MMSEVEQKEQGCTLYRFRTREQKRTVMWSLIKRLYRYIPWIVPPPIEPDEVWVARITRSDDAQDLLIDWPNAYIEGDDDCIELTGSTYVRLVTDRNDQ